MKVAAAAAPDELVEGDREPLARRGVLEVRARPHHAAGVDAVEEAPALAVRHDGVSPQVRDHCEPPGARGKRNSR